MAGRSRVSRHGTSPIWGTRTIAAVVAAACLLLVAAKAAQKNQGRQALWDIVHTMCVPGEAAGHNPMPCTAVDLDGGVDKGYAILKDLRGASQYLLIATARIAGIESPELLAPDAPNYFADAWESRSYVNAAMHQTLPRDDISLAINSAVARSQDQLHIHIDCVREDVHAALRLHGAEIGSSWEPLRVSLITHHYMARWVPGETLGDANPFKMLAEELPGAAKNMGDRTLVVIGATRADGTPGFFILENEVHRISADMASGEELQDHSCHIAAPQSASRN
jgi:CDP-diacylglycerol pyrophosphatase